MAISMHPMCKKRRALRRKWLRAGCYWADLCRTKNGKPVYRWIYVRMRAVDVPEVIRRTSQPTKLGEVA